MCIGSTYYLICFDAIHYVRRPIMEAKKRLRTYGHLINNIIGCNNIVLDSMSKFNLKIETNFIKYCMGKGEWGITLVELGKEWGRVIECSLL